METVTASPLLSSIEAHEAMVSDALARIASDATANADKGKLAVSTLLSFQDYANERIGSGKTIAYQRLVSLAHPALKGGAAGYKNVKAFLLVMFAGYLGPLDTKGQPDAHRFETVFNAWKHDLRQGDRDRALGGKGKRKGGRKAVTLAALLSFMDKKLPRFKGPQEDRNRLKEAFDTWYAKASGLPVPAATVPAELDKAA